MGIFLAVAIVMMILGAAAFAFWIWSIIDAVRFADAEWAAAEQNKIVWVVLIVVLGALASLIYVFWPRPSLKRARASLATGAPGQAHPPW